MKFIVSFAAAAIAGVKASQVQWGHETLSTDIGKPGNVLPATISQPPSYSRSQYSQISYDGPSYNKASSATQDYGQNNYVSKPDYNQGSYGSQVQESYGQDTYGKESYGLDTYGQDSYGQDSYGQESYGLDTYGQDSYGQESYGQDSYGQESYGLDTYGQDSYSRDYNGQDSYGQESYGEDIYGQESYGHNSYGQDSYGQPSYGKDSYSQPSYGKDSYSQPSYGRDSYDQKVGTFGRKTFGGQTFSQGSFGRDSYGYGSDSHRSSLDSRVSLRNGGRSTSDDYNPLKSRSFGIGSRNLKKSGLSNAGNDFGNKGQFTLEGMGFQGASLSNMGFSKPGSPNREVALSMKDLGLGVVASRPNMSASHFGLQNKPQSPAVAPKKIGGLSYNSAPKYQTYDSAELQPSKYAGAGYDSPYSSYDAKPSTSSYGSYNSATAPHAYDTPKYYAHPEQSYDRYATPAIGKIGGVQRYESYPSVGTVANIDESYSGDIGVKDTYADSYSAPIAGKSQFGLGKSFGAYGETSINSVPELGHLDSSKFAFQSSDFDGLNHSAQYGPQSIDQW